MNGIILTNTGEFYQTHLNILPMELRRCNGEVLIERIIKQMREMDIKDIYVVVGGSKASFFYLQEEFGVEIIDNQKPWLNDNYQLLLCADLLSDSYLCYGFAFFMKNPFEQRSDLTRWSETDNLNNRLYNYYFGDEKNDAIVRDICYFIPQNVVSKLTDIIYNKTEQNNLESSRYIEFGTLKKEIINGNIECRCENVENNPSIDILMEMRTVDNVFNDNIARNILDNIECNIGCDVMDAKGVFLLSGGNTNTSFVFNACNKMYVYRCPGASSGSFVDRYNEVVIQNRAKELGIDPTCIFINTEGVKISKYIRQDSTFDYDDDKQMRQMIFNLKKIHDEMDCGEVNEFEVIKKAHTLLEKADEKNGYLLERFSTIEDKVIKLYEYTKKDGVKKTVCHCDVHAGNFLVTNDNVYIIDWEFSGICDLAYDLGCMISYEWFSDERIEEIFEMYMHNMSSNMKRHFRAYIAIAGWYYFCWSCYKESIDELVPFNMYNRYRNVIRFLDRGLKEYEE